MKQNEIDLVLIRPNGKKEIYNGVADSTTASAPPYWLALMGAWLKKQ